MISHPRIQFRQLFALAVIACLAFGAESQATETRVAGELLSKITMSDVLSVKDDSSQDSSGGNQNSTGTAVLGTESLSRFLTQSNIKHDVQRNHITVGPQQTASGQMLPSGLTLRLTVDADSNRVIAELPIRLIPEADTDNETSLMQTLRKTTQLPKIHLGIRDNRLTLETWLTNQHVDESIMLKAIDRLSEAYRVIQTPATSIGETATASKISLAGTWSAKTSQTDGWAVRFEASGNYTLVHTNKGKNTVSKGTYQIENQALILTETNGTRLAGILTTKNANTFQWTLRNKAGIAKMTLHFKSTR